MGDRSRTEVDVVAGIGHAAMVLQAARLPDDPWARRGCYGSKGQARGVNLPERMRYLHPGAYAALLAFEAEYPGLLMFSDMFRAPSVSLQMVRDGRAGAQPPGYSGHNWLLSFDADLAATKRRCAYPLLLERLAAHGFHCHRRDGLVDHEAWHFNWLGPDADAHLATARKDDRKTWSRPLENRIAELYGHEFGAEQIEGRLILAGTPGSVLNFQRLWGLVQDGIAGPRTLRTLARVTARMEIV